MNFSGESGQCVEFFPLGLSRILKAERIEYQTNPHPGLQSVEAGADPEEWLVVTPSPPDFKCFTPELATDAYIWG